MARNGKRALSFIMALVLALSLLPTGVLALDEETPAQVEQAAETPAATEIPTETAAPEATAAPTETAAPEATAAPTETAAPEATAAPIETTAPVETAAPAETAAPTATETPEIRYPAFSADVSAEDNNGMAVAVTAPEGAFPEGTELSVKPVRDSSVKAALDSVLEFFGLGSLVGESPLDKIADALGAGTEQDAAAFDITFLYNGKEVQPAADPATGEPFAVTVTFTPGEDSTLTGAGDLQVYHITDGDKGLNADAVKTADAGSITAEPVDAVDGTGADGTVTVEATSFSIYVVSNENKTSLQGTMITDGGSYTVVLGENGNKVYFYSNVFNSAQTSGTHKWTSSDTSVAAVIYGTNSTTGKQATVTLKKAGTTTITHQYTRPRTQKETSESFSLKILATNPVSIKDTIATNGCLTAAVDSAVLTGTLTYQWYRCDTNSATDSDWSLVTDVDSLSTDGTSVNVAINQGAQKWYKLVVTNTDAEQAETQFTSYPYQDPYYASVQNGTFEATGQGQQANGTAGLIWKTTGTGTLLNKGDETGHDVEIGTPDTPDYKVAEKDLASSTSGRQFAELNCETDGALYQDIITSPGSTLNWSFYHRARYNNPWVNGGKDTMYLIIMPTSIALTGGANGGPIDTQAEVTTAMEKYSSDSRVSIAKYDDDNTCWHYKSGNYPVSADQYLTRFFFVSGATTSGDNTIGNLIDDVKCSTGLTYSIDYYVDNELQQGMSSSGTAQPFARISAQVYSQYALEKITMNNVDYGRYDFAVLGDRNALHENCLKIYYVTTGISVTKNLSGMEGATLASEDFSYTANFTLYAGTDTDMNTPLATASVAVGGSGSGSALFMSGSTKFVPTANATYKVKEATPAGIAGYAFVSTSVGAETGDTHAVTVDNMQVGNIAFTNSYSQTQDVTFDKIWDGEVGSGISVVLKDANDKTYNVAIPSAVGATYTGSHTVDLTDSHIWHCTVSGLPAGASYHVDNETQIDGYKTTYIPASYIPASGSTAVLSSVQRITPCNELSIQNNGSPFMVIQSQGKFYLWTADELSNTDKAALEAAIATADSSKNFGTIDKKGSTAISGRNVTLTTGNSNEKLDKSTIIYADGNTTVNFFASSAWDNVLVGRYDMASTTPKIINSQSTATQDVTFTKTWAGNAGRPTADSIGVTISDGSNTYTGTVTTSNGTLNKTAGSGAGTVNYTVDGATGDWTVTVSGLPASAAGYTVTETAVNGTGFADGKAANGTDGYWVKSGDNSRALTNTYYKYNDVDAYGSVDLTITKTDAASGAPLSGAVFALYASDACTGTPKATTAETAANGQTTLTFSSLAAGTYYIKEMTAPENHVLPTAYVKAVTVAQNPDGAPTLSQPDGNYVVTRTQNHSASISGEGISGNAVTITNEINTYNLTVTKSIVVPTTSQDPTSYPTFSFTVRFGTGTAAMTSGAYVTNGSYTFALAATKDNNASQTITGVPYGTNYTVTETITGTESALYNSSIYNATTYTNTTSGTMGAENATVSVTNSYFKSVTENITVSKAWSEWAGAGSTAMTAEDSRIPDNVTIQVKQNGENYGDAITLTKTETWSRQISVPKYATADAASEYTYTAAETEVNGTGFDGNGRVVVNGTHATTAEAKEVLGYWTTGANGTAVTNTWYDSDDIGSATISIRKYIKGTTTYLSGAVFSLTGTLDGKVPYNRGAANEVPTNGTSDVSFNNLQPGEYTLTEKSAPSGYQKDSTSWTFTVTETGKVLMAVNPPTTTTNVFQNIWRWVVSAFTDNGYSNGVLTVYNTPVVTNVAKTVWSKEYTASSFDAASYTDAEKWGPSASFTENPGVTTATALFKVVVTGTPGADYTLADTAMAGATLTKVSGNLTGTIPDGGSVTVYYTMTVPVDGATYTNTATVGTLSATATATASTDTAQKAAITVNYWKQNSYGDYAPTNYTKVTADSIENQEMAYGSTALASTYATGDKYPGYTLSPQNAAAPTSIAYQAAYNANHAAVPSNLVINVYYDLDMPTMNLTAHKEWNHGTGSGANSAVNKDSLGAVSFQLQRSSDGTTWANVGDAVSVTTTTNGTNGTYTWNSMPKYVENSTTEYTYRVHEVTVPTGYATTTNDAVFAAGATAGVMSATITNTYDPTYLDVDGTKASFTINKVGDDGTKLAGAVFTLTKTGETSGTAYTTTGTNGTVTVGGLTDGVYTLTETTAPGGYTKSSSSWTITVAKDAPMYGTPNVNNQITRTQNYSISAITGSKDTATDKDYVIKTAEKSITVTDTRDTGTLSVSKDVTGAMSKSDFAKEAFSFDIKDSTGKTVKTVKLPVEDGTGALVWTVNVTLPTGTYTVAESAPVLGNGYSIEETVSYGNDASGTARTNAAVTKGGTASVAVTNAYTYSPDNVSITAYKIWADDSNRDGVRPAFFTLTLTDANDTVIETKTVTAATADAQTVTFSFDAYANSYVSPFKVTETKYTLANGTEVAIGSTGAAYTVVYTSGNNTNGTVAGNAITITNTHAVEMVTINVAKKWTQPAYAREVTLNLADGSGAVVKPVTLDGTVDTTETAAWSASFGSFPKNAGGKAIAYTVTETSLGTNWSCTVTSDMAAATDNTYHFTVTNSLYVPYIPPEKPIPDPDVPLEPTPVTPVEPGTDITDPDVPQAGAAEQATGDELYLWIALATASGLSLAWLAISGKKRRDGNDK
ncbi:MAG: SpaA isopeptide-forming pilin-related protein [Oscillospiraceae bacterium]|nr:SpaA isopeptide-forming pilin-related protein [Oscillospiraceae bacterium]